MLAIHAQNKKISDKSFQISQNAIKASNKYGKENVINATLGIFYNEDEKMHTLKIVEKEYKQLPTLEIYNYASNIGGENLFQEAVKKHIFNKINLENNYVEVVATPGASGAIYNSLTNYVNCGDEVLVPNYMWGSYKLMINEAGGRCQNYSLFNNENMFDLKGFKISVMELAKKQKNLVVLLNNPCHNPTGYTLESFEIKKIMEILKEACAFCNVVVINDIAYMDFNNQENKIEEFCQNLPKNLLMIITFSMSKSFCCYGLRVGAQIAITSSKNVRDEFLEASLYTCRSIWSNISRGGMVLFSNIVLNDEKYKIFLKEQNEMKKIIKNRAEIFLDEAKKINLPILPYKDGFFITIPFDKYKQNEVEDRLQKENIFAIVFENAIRIAICSVPKYKIYGLSEKIKNILY